MNGRRLIAGLCMLCALLATAFAAQGALAVTGTKAFTCVLHGGDEDLRGTHCSTTAQAPQTYGHVPFTEKTELAFSNANSANNTTEAATGRLKTTIAGVPLELGATGVTGSGTIENGLNGSEHFASSEGSLTFTGVAVTQPSGRGCKVYTDNEATKTKGEEGVVHTRVLKTTTKEQGHFVKLEPADGPTKSFANFFVECEAGKQVPAIEGTWECIGSVKGVPTGSTTTAAHVASTAENTLKCKGTKAGIEGTGTELGSKIGEITYGPISRTTVST